ncbi:MAG: hypothetical protein LBH82_03800 [Bacteroidales bacterium]|jgi:hypothetical protein|nr:hypothetical protein [Bacteroidales bacterium]
MIVSRKTVLWSGIVIVALFAIINRVKFYADSDVVYADLHLVASSDTEYLYQFSYKYQEQIHYADYRFAFEQNTDRKKKLLINKHFPQQIFLFTFTGFFLSVLIISFFAFALWIAFIESFFPKHKQFYFFNKATDE